MKKILFVLFATVFTAHLFIAAGSSAKAGETKTFVGKIEKVRNTLFPTPPKLIYYKFTVVADNGEEKEICVPKGFSNIIDINGKPRWGAPPKKGKVEVKYSVAEDGSNEIVSMRYIPSDYVPQPATLAAPDSVSSETTPPVRETAGQTGNTCTGKIESIQKRFGKPPKWEYARITVIADTGEKMIISAIKATAVTDAVGKDLNEDGSKFGALSLKKGERIEVKYSTEANSRNEAISIHGLD